MFGIVEQGGDLAKARAELIGDVAPGLSGSLTIGLNEDLANSGRDDTLLTFPVLCSCRHRHELFRG